MKRMGLLNQLKARQIRLFSLTMVGMVLTMCFQNCAGSMQAYELVGSEQASSLSPMSAKTCQFVGPRLLSDRLRNVLGITVGDVPVLSDSGAPLAMGRIQQARGIMGLGDLSIGKIDDWSCGTSKFKAGIEVMIDACSIAVTNPEVKAALFPQSLENFDAVYLALLGRVPTAYEAEILKEIAGQMPPEKAEAAVCGAVAASFESLVKI